MRAEETHRSVHCHPQVRKQRLWGCRMVGRAGAKEVYVFRVRLGVVKGLLAMLGACVYECNMRPENSKFRYVMPLFSAPYSDDRISGQVVEKGTVERSPQWCPSRRGG
jgi:hypothetical protein